MDLIVAVATPHVWKQQDVIEEDKHLSKLQWKILVRKAIHKKSEENVKQVFKHYSKRKNKDLENEELSIKSYVKNMKLRDARTYFHIRGNMIKTKMNMKNDNKRFQMNFGDVMTASLWTLRPTSYGAQCLPPWGKVKT